MELSLSSQFNTTIPVDLGLFVEQWPPVGRAYGHSPRSSAGPTAQMESNLTYTLSYPDTILTLAHTSSDLDFSLIHLWNTMIINPFGCLSSTTSAQGRFSKLQQASGGHVSCTAYPDLQDWIF